MKTTLLVSISLALGTGFLIGMQSTLSGRIGAAIGSLRTGLLMNIAAGIVSLVIVGLLLLSGSWSGIKIPVSLVGLLFLAGTIGIGVVAGVSSSVQRVGVATGLALVIFGQLSLSLAVDTFGLGGAQPIPLSPARVVGVLGMLGSAYLMLPR